MGFGLLAIHSAGGHFAPGALALGRLLVASLALGVVWLLSGGWATRAAWSGILGSGLLWFGLPARRWPESGLLWRRTGRRSGCAAAQAAQTEL
jgi:hypothetical protein